jgi:hypothetical protein
MPSSVLAFSLPTYMTMNNASKIIARSIVCGGFYGPCLISYRDVDSLLYPARLSPMVAEAFTIVC